ncbi:inactive ubiquitin carboxyl-terminal hydrolase 54 [Elysia marginata]|uniref:Inactive ubiquitin carboxyl-terminal hydrolase 54 n=1 Tax=Elysia marginata TaxID=1093978 RepID=A0AAV4IZ40_9GAST|nr:inactive ubiquitin carboxyl-terminal hydrolase 54 [Elysia marginata]
MSTSTMEPDDLDYLLPANCPDPYFDTWDRHNSIAFSTATKGLRNAPGENNCFVNSAVQSRPGQMTNALGFLLISKPPKAFGLTVIFKSPQLEGRSLRSFCLSRFKIWKSEVWTIFLFLSILSLAKVCVWRLTWRPSVLISVPCLISLLTIDLMRPSAQTVGSVKVVAPTVDIHSAGLRLSCLVVRKTFALDKPLKELWKFKNPMPHLYFSPGKTIVDTTEPRTSSYDY